MNKHFAEKIKYLRTRLNLNQFEFANLIGIKQPSLSTYERGISSPALDVAITIAEKCNVSLDWLCGLENQTTFYTGADFINTFLKIRKMPGFKYDINTDSNTDWEMNISRTITLTFTGKYESQLRLDDEIKEDFNVNDFSEFMQEYEALEKKLESFRDDELSENYKKMWLEKKLQEYANYKIVGEE